MSRLIIPDDFAGQLTLLSNIITKNNADNKTGPLGAFLTQQNINLDDDIAAAETAQTHDFNRQMQSKQSENYRQLRDNSFKTPWQHLTGSVQFLKSFYTGNTKELGNWGITITDSGKVNYPPAFIDRAAVFTAFAEKHNSFAPGESPLNAFLAQQNIDLIKDAAIVQQAADNNAAFIAAAQQSENETQLRNQLWKPILAHLKAIGNFLMKLYTNNPKALGAWGFVVDESIQKPKLRTSTLKPGETRTFHGLAIGGLLTNTGSGDLHLYRSDNTKGAVTIINAGEQFGIVKGYSMVTIENPSTLSEGKFTVQSIH